MSIVGPVLESRVPVFGSRREPSFSVGRLRIAASVFQRFIAITEIAADFATCVAAVLAAYAGYVALSIGKHLYYPPRELLFISSAIGLVCVFLFERESAYRGGASLMRIRETERSIRISCETILLFLPLTWVIGQSYSRGMFLLLLPLLPFLMLMQKQMMSWAVHAVYAKGHGLRQSVIYGAALTGRRLFSTLVQSPKLGYEPVAILDMDVALEGSVVHELGYNRRRSLQVRNEEITEEFLHSVRCHTLFIAVSGLSSEEVYRLTQTAAAAEVEVAFLSGSRTPAMHTSAPVDMDGLLLTFASERRASRVYHVSKWLVDKAVSLLLLAALSPLLLLTAMLVRLDSEGSAFFWQERVGKCGKRFRIYKFRTMYVASSHYERSPMLSGDARITRVGRFLRRTSFDELPQLINVLFGDMSLVGPRPEMPFLVEEYDHSQRQRLQVLPGITGLWQISGDRAFQIHENLEYDQYYIRHRGFFLDMALLAHTALFAMKGV